MLKKKYIIGFLVCGLLLFINYLLAGILGEVFNEGSTLGTAIVTVLSTPFSNHFNDFTPLTIIIGVVIFEVGWFMIYIKPSLSKKNNDEKEKSDESEIITEEKKSPFIKEKEEPKPPFIDTDNEKKQSSDSNMSSFGFVIPEDIKAVEEKTVKEENGFVDPGEVFSESTIESAILDNSIDDSVEEISSFSSDAFWQLNGEYSSDQIKEMVKLKKYMKSIDVETLKATFKPSLEPAEIREYIELFYG